MDVRTARLALALVVVLAALAAVSTVAPASGTPADKRFWVKDKHHYTSPWYAGAHRKMIGFGCTRAPYYAPDPRCSDDRGYHHGLDVAMRCGTLLRTGLKGRIKQPGSAGSLGSAYGSKAFRIHNERFDIDIVIGHARRLYVRPGDKVRRGDRVARAGKLGAPDGCHLHFEVRPEGGAYTAAVLPKRWIRMRRAD